MEYIEKLVQMLKCNSCHSENLFFSESAFNCADCANSYSYENGVVDTFLSASESIAVIEGESQINTSKHYGSSWVSSMNEWSENNGADVRTWHYDQMEQLFKFPSRCSGIGLEGGCGHGKDTVLLARANPDALIIAVDLSDGAYVTASRVAALGINNVIVIRASMLDLPLREGLVDWLYSFGVFHHTPSTQKCFTECARVMKSDAKMITYLYSDLKEFPLLRLGVKLLNTLRPITKRLPLGVLNGLCIALAPVVFLSLTVPARILKSVGLVSLAEKIPHHHNKTVKSVIGELYDRFGAQVENRYNPSELREMHEKAGFEVQGIDRIPIWRGWVSFAEKKA
jgi:SAM-dependent methyltransferase